MRTFDMLRRARGIPRTPWFPHMVTPVHRGYYEVRNDGTIGSRHSKFLTGGDRTTLTRYWDGERWMTEKHGYASVMGTHHSHQWRGLTRPAKG